MIPPLSPADVQTLRDSVKWRGTSGDLAHASAIVYLPADETFALLSEGRIMATAANVQTLAACLVAERAERGFIRRIMDPSADCSTASLDPAARQRVLAQQRANAIRIRELQAADAETKRRRANMIDVTKLDLEDL